MTGDPATQEWLGSALSALAAARQHEHCAWRDLAEKLRIERDEAQAALADYLRKET